MAFGKLTLVPTFLNEDLALESNAVVQIKQALDASPLIAPLIVVEEAKNARRRWLSSGLPREMIEHFVLLNEHQTQCQDIVKELKNGRNVFLMSDCGLPAFFDPGQKLIEACHRQSIAVSATPFANSFSLALALSGFEFLECVFMGHPPRNQTADFWQRMAQEKRVICFHDAPYRLSQTLSSLDSSLQPTREVFLALDLGLPSEQLARMQVQKLNSRPWPKKAEYVIVVGPQNL